MTPPLGYKPTVGVISGVILLLSFIPFMETASYLFYGVDSGSMGLNTKYVGEALAARGHNVTFVALEPFSDKFFHDFDENNHNFSLIRVEDTFPKYLYDELALSVSSAALESRLDDIFYDMKDKFTPVLTNYTKRLMNNSGLMARLHSQHFDLAFFESMLHEFYHITRALKVPFVIMDPMITNPFASWLMRADRNPAYYPGNFVDFDQHMTFMQRLQSTLANIDGFVKNGIFRWLLEPSSEWNDHIQVPIDKPSIQIQTEAQLWFIRTHFALDYPRSLPPHVIPIGGQMARPSQSLPQVFSIYL